MNNNLRKLYKHYNIGNQELRRSRRMLAVELRKFKKQQEFQQRRHFDITQLDDDDNTMLTAYDTLYALSSGVLAQNVVGVQAARQLLATFGREGGLINIDLLQRLLPALLQYLRPSVAVELQVHVVWTLANITDDSSAAIQAVVHAGGVPPLIALLTSVNSEIVLPALHAVGNIVSGDDQQTNLLIAAGALPLLYKLLAHKDQCLVQQAIAIVCKISMGTPERIQFLIAANIFRPLRQLLVRGDRSLQMEAAWTIMNMTRCATLRQIVTTFERYTLLRPYCDLLASDDVYTVMVVEIGIANIFALCKQQEEVNAIRLMVVAANGLQKLKLLFYHRNAEIYKKAVGIVTAYFRDCMQDVLCDYTDDNDINMELDGDMDDNSDQIMMSVYNGPMIPNSDEYQRGPTAF